MANCASTYGGTPSFSLQVIDSRTGAVYDTSAVPGTGTTVTQVLQLCVKGQRQVQVASAWHERRTGACKDDCATEGIPDLVLCGHRYPTRAQELCRP